MYLSDLNLQANDDGHDLWSLRLWALPLFSPRGPVVSVEVSTDLAAQKSLCILIRITTDESPSLSLLSEQTPPCLHPHDPKGHKFIPSPLLSSAPVPPRLLDSSVLLLLHTTFSSSFKPTRSLIISSSSTHPDKVESRLQTLIPYGDLLFPHLIHLMPFPDPPLPATFPL